MKIFAKRTRKQPSADSGGDGDDKKRFQSDAIVEEQLLKQDPSTWNAKQRRLVKRYQDRHRAPETATGITPSSSADEKQPPEADAKAVKNKEEDQAQKEEEKNDDDSSSEDHSSSDDDDDDDSSEPEKSDGKPNEFAPSLTQEKDDKADRPVEGAPPSSTRASANEPIETTETKELKETPAQNAAIDEELQSMLDKLNSKQRRKLMRSLERGGDVKAVRAETRSLLGLDKKEDTTTAKEADRVAASNKDGEPPKKKRRRNKKDVDLSKLPAEERLRREEQRRLQQEAAQARANGTAVVAPGKKHPLNSERRRANRRKPKWEPRRNNNSMPSNEHNSSGYHMRKITGGES